MYTDRKNTGRRITVFVCTGLLSTGLILPSIARTPIVKTVRAEEISEKTEKLLQAGDYIEGEVIVFAADTDAAAYSSRGNDLLSQAEDLYTVDSGVENPGTAYSVSENTREAAEPEEINGTIKLVKSRTMSTKALIEALYEDPRVLYAEPNYILTVSGEEQEGNGKETSVQNSSAEKETAETDSSPQTKEEAVSAQKDEPSASSQSPKKEASASDSSSDPSKQKNAHKEESDAAPLTGETPTPSNFGPSGHTPGQIPDMTEWQWGNWNSGNMAGTYSHAGTADIQYSEWKTQTREEMPEYVVAVLDSGIDETNPDLKDILWTGDVFGPGGDSHGCFMYSPSNDEATAPGNSSTTGMKIEHGSHVAGIIAAQWNGKGTSGIASNVKVMSLRMDLSYASTFSCMAYAKKAVKQGVNLIAVNNSWGMGLNSTDLINLAVTDLGKMGVVSVFASANDHVNTDQTLTTVSTLANNPYVVTVDSINPTGSKAYYSNFGVQTTDIMAPGSIILSTVINDEKTMSFMGEINAHAPAGSEARNNLVSYSSFDDQSVNPFESFAVYTDEKGVSWGSDLNYPVVQPAAGTFDGTGALSVKTNDDGYVSIVSSVNDLSGLEAKPRFVSYRYTAEQPGRAPYSKSIRVPVIYTHQDGSKTKAYKSVPAVNQFGSLDFSYAGAEADLSNAETVTKEEAEQGITGSCINWEEFSVVFEVELHSPGSLTPGTVYFDSIALGSCRYPYSYLDGTSMAAPAAVGVLSVIAGQHADSLGTLQTPAFAEKLAALVKGSAVVSLEYDQLCATSGLVSVEGANNPGPVISVIEDGQDTFTLTGYYLDGASVTLDDASCTYTAETKENDRSILTVQKPDGYQGGAPVIAVLGTNGKKDRSVVNISPASGKEIQGLYDQVNIPLPAGLTNWRNYDVEGYNGKIYVFPRVSSDLGPELSNLIFAYDPKSGAWDEIKIPIEELTFDGKQVLKNVMDITACVKDGKLFMLIYGETEPEVYKSVLVSMNHQADFEVLGYQNSFYNIPAKGTIFTDGTDLYLAGGVTLQDPENKKEETKAARQIGKLTVSESNRISFIPSAEMKSARVWPRISFLNGTAVISGGAASDRTGKPVSLPAEGAEQFTVGQKETKTIEVSSMIDSLPNRSFSSGALADGTFILAGLVSKGKNADTYILSQDLSLEEYEKRAWTASIMNPASVAYDNAFYVLAAIAPSGAGQSTLVFSSTAANAGIPAGDALVRKINTAPAKTGTGMPEFENTDIAVTQNDLISNLKDQAQKAIDQINQAEKDSEVYLEAAKLAEKDVPQTEKEAILSAADQEKMKDSLFWMNIDMYLQIPEQDRIKLDRNEAGTKVAIKLPDFPE
ncbi:MAG: S8 family serine peptidase, partial [Erysipelotrichaceae bacterium]|nr:S8 family serine peptidase [Erysipelotrichaceae bacterium]